MQITRAVLWAVVVLVSSARFGVSVKSSSETDGTDTPQARSSSSRAKRMSQFSAAGQDDALPEESLHEGLEDAAARTSPCYFLPSDASQSYGFFRNGRSNSRFVRIGKAHSQPHYKRHSNFVRIGRSAAQLGNPLHRFRRTSQFVRIGKDSPNYAKIATYPCDPAYGDGYDKDYLRLARSPSNFVRIGRSEFQNGAKRASSFVRIGKNSEVDTAETPDYSDFPGQGYFGIHPESNDRDLSKRMSSFVRIGKSFEADSDLMKRVSNFVRIGKSGEDEKRGSSFVRIGKSEANGENERDKRISNFVRIGKSGLDEDTDVESSKRGSSFVRIGKMSPLDGSYPSQYSQDDSTGLFPDDRPLHVANRGSSFVRIGKMPSSAFVRIGKNSDIAEDEYKRLISG
uniref:Fxriamide 1 n=1 Tax=Deroceras reticulatum TaxID=145610 RepID=A0A1X9WEG2_DERRE|nr:fxriamide 1 [Deroceras reticulatum]